MKVMIEVNLTGTQVTSAANRLAGLVDKKAPDSSESTTIKARYDDVIELVKGLGTWTKIHEDEEGPYWLEGRG